MKRLFEIVKERHALEYKAGQLKKDFEQQFGHVNRAIQELKRLENVAESGINLEKVQLAETVISVKGNPYGRTSDVYKFGACTIAEAAMIDIANGCAQLKNEFIGNKEYESYYQRCDCKYGYGPRHGYIVDSIELSLRGMKRDLTEDEKDAAIYYLKNYLKIAEAKKKLTPAT